MEICIVYTKDSKVAGLWIDLEKGKQAAKEIGGWYQIRHTIDGFKSEYGKKKLKEMLISVR